MGAPERGEESQPDPDLEVLRRYLANRDASCPTCGYNLRDLGQCTCPECGDTLSLALTNHPTRLAGYTVGLVGLTLSLLLAALFAIVAFGEHPLISIVSGFAVAWLSRSALRWRRSRKAFGGLPRHKKQEQVVACWAAAIVFFTLLLGLTAFGRPV